MVESDPSLQEVPTATAENGNVSVVQLKPILDAQEKHGPIFRRELFDVAYAACLAINDKDPNEHVYMSDGRQTRSLRTPITLLDIYGVEKKRPVLREGRITEHDSKPYVSKRAWIYNQLQSLGTMYGEVDVDWSLLPFEFGTIDVPLEEEQNTIHPEFHNMAAQWREEWKASGLYAHLTAFLEEHAGDAAQRVDQIICFGLGCPFSVSSYPRKLRRSFMQHLAACTLRDIFASNQNCAAPTIFAQDPAYQSTDTAYLAEHFNIATIADPDGFKALNGHTFVVTVSPNVPVRQIALDMTHESNGPAGFFCDSIASDGLEGDGKSREDAYSGANGYRTCSSSPGLWKYKQESIWMEHGERKENGPWNERECFGHIGVYLKKRG
jgi:hypothetical protein